MSGVQVSDGVKTRRREVVLANKITNESLAKPALLNLAVEEENLATIPFAVLERRVGKRVGKIETKGTKTLADGTKVKVVWQVQGNADVGLPTEQDLDIFIAVGVLTFRNNFAKTVSFTGREIAKILKIHGVHGKFYNRLKLAMDRLIALRFRALASSKNRQEVKWINVFQEASFSLNRETGRSTGSVTWTDKLVRSMDRGFFRFLDASRYMDLDGLTAKHLYRFLAIAFEKTDLLVVDTRELALQHLGIARLPKYFSRLMQTLEPVFDQLIRIQVMGSYHVVSPEHWRVALHRHPAYVTERETLIVHSPGLVPEMASRKYAETLENLGFTKEAVDAWRDSAHHRCEIYGLQRGARLAEELRSFDVAGHVVTNLIRRVMEMGPAENGGRDLLDWCQLGLEVASQKRQAGQKLTNLPGLIVKIITDPSSRRRFVSEGVEQEAKRRFRQQEEAALRAEEEAEERALVHEYEEYRQQLVASVFEEMPETSKKALRREKTRLLRQQGRFSKIPAELRQREIDQLVCQDLAKKEAPPFEKWLLRKQAAQAVLPFLDDEATSEAT